jgi:hypothetical protein
MTKDDGLLDGIYLNSMDETPAMRVIRGFMAFELVALAAAALVHFGVLFSGLEHWRAGTAESVLATVLLLGLLLTWIRPAWARAVGITAQAFALLGTLVGLFTVAIGIGPRTVPDVTYHVGMVLLLIVGILSAIRSREIGV